jgi:hypothetical protein
MISDIEQVIHKNVEGFLEQTAKEFDIPMAKLKENWKAHLASASSPSLSLEEKGEPEKKKPVKKTSLYQNFFVHKRVELLENNPGLQFGELSFQISQLWNKLTKEEQKTYTASAPVIAPVSSPPRTVTNPSLNVPALPVPAVPVPVVPVPAVPVPVVPVKKKDGFDFESLNSKNMPELRKLCEEKGLKRTGNKLMLIQNLLGIHPTVVIPPVAPPPAVSRPLVDEAEDVEVVVAKNMKRADIEEEIPDIFSDDEQDFDFEEEGSHYSVTQEEDD